MLGVYTRKFGDCQLMKQYLAEVGFEVNFDSYFFGCATGVSGHKPV
jgi:demethylmenaquinone methyltransferase/2-methoxy-6-polyprenyl-1,4-benzoquinol methylase